MSILPAKIEGSRSSSSLNSPLVNPSSDNGHVSSGSPPSLPNSLSSDFESMRPSASPPSIPFSAGSSSTATEDSGRSSRKVIESGTPDGKRNYPHPNVSPGSQGVGSSNLKGRTCGVNSQGSSGNSSTKRAPMTNANHLLNFHYDPIVRSQPRKAPPPSLRRPRKIKLYNKDLFLQANYKFVVLDTGVYSLESLDPDKMLKWEHIICVRYSTPFSVQCPICLEYPLCPQITSCGHIFCFPCILQYLLMGEEDSKGDCFKRCPLCFVMISPKDLCTIYIENVKQYCVGDTLEFRLLTRQKDSFTPSLKNKKEKEGSQFNDDIYDPFSKFTFTSDVELSVRKAISDLDSWLARADSGLVDDIEKLLYVCAAMEHLEQRKKYWNEQRACNDGSSYKCVNSQKAALGGDSSSDKHVNSQKAMQGDLLMVIGTGGDNEASASMNATLSSDINDQSKCFDHGMLGVADTGQDEILSSTYEEGKSILKPSNGLGEVKDKEAYHFYQAIDGQHLILHPLNMKCLLCYYGSYDMLPNRISGKILEFETVTQSEAIRRRYRYLSHFSLTTTFQLCEIDMSEMLPPDALSPFMDEIKRREKQRKQRMKKDLKDKIKAEVAASQSSPFVSNSWRSSYDDAPSFSMDDFEALGSTNGTTTAMSSSPPVVGERMLFSNVTRFGFAAAHDSPALKIEEVSAQDHNRMLSNSHSSTGSRNSEPASFANIISRAKNGENVDATKMNETGKKGRKTNRVLLSTAGGRRY